MKKIKKTHLVILSVILLCVVIAVMLLPKLPAWRAEWQIGNPKEHSDYVGELIIKQIGIEISCIETDIDDLKYTQTVVDKSECAAMTWYPLSGVSSGDSKPGAWVIGDHNYQGFDQILNLNIGDEVSLLLQDGTVKKYQVMEACEGYINEAKFPVNAVGEELLKNDPDNILLMTCFEEADVQADVENRRFFVYLEYVTE